MRHSLPALDGLRGLACLTVVILHSEYLGWLYLVPQEAGFFSVWLFFALSGFLMGYHYLPGELTWKYWLTFSTRRFFRVYPVFMLMVLLAWILPHTISSIAHCAIFGSWADVPSHWLLLEGESIFWTVSVELKFYAIFAAIAVLLLLSRLPHKYLPALWCILWLVCTGMSESGMYKHEHMITVLPRLPFFVGGAAAGYYCAISRPSSKWAGFAWGALAIICSSAVISLVVSPSFVAIDLMPIGEYDHIWLKSLLLSLGLLAYAKSTRWVQLPFSNPPAVFLGSISLSLYLIHNELLCYLRQFFEPSWPVIAGAFTCTIFIAFLSYRWIEKPMQQLGIRLTKKF